MQFVVANDPAPDSANTTRLDGRAGLLVGKVVVVSGLGPGLGRHVARRSAMAGAKCVLGARTPEKIDEVVAEISELGGEAMGRRCDVRDPADCAALIAAGQEHFGGIDVLVNNAFRGPSFRPVADADTDNWRKTFDVNVFGTLEMTQAAIPAIRARGGGSIVFVNSMASRDTPPGQADYAASKASLFVIARSLAAELGPDKIRVNTVVPGWMWGPGVQWYCDNEAKQRGCDPSDVYDEIAANIALGEIPTDEDCAGAVVFFASELSNVITGQALDVNGGEYFA